MGFESSVGTLIFSIKAVDCVKTPSIILFYSELPFHDGLYSFLVCVLVWSEMYLNDKVDLLCFALVFRNIVLMLDTHIKIQIMRSVYVQVTPVSSGVKHFFN